MGIRIFIGAIIAVLLGGTGYFAQQSHLTKSSLEKREIELSKEKENSAKLTQDILRLEAIEKQVEELRSQLKKVGGSAKSQNQKMSQLIAAKNAELEQERMKSQNLEITLKQNQTTLADERKARAEAEKAGAKNSALASAQTEEVKRLEEAKTLAEAQIQEMSQLIAEKTTAIERGKAKNQNLAETLKQNQTILADERKARAEVEKAGAKNSALASARAEKIKRLEKNRQLLQGQIQEMGALLAEKTSVADMIRNNLNQTSLSLAEAIKKHTLAIARSKTLEKKARTETERAERLKENLTKMNRRLKTHLITLQRTRNLLRVTIVSSLLFDSGSAELSESGIETLSKIAEFLKAEKGKMIQIEGHTDNQPIQGLLARRYPTNWELSSARAIAVVKFLESKNIPPERLSAAAYSFHRPAASNDTEEERARNRRIIILLKSPTPTTGK